MKIRIWIPAALLVSAGVLVATCPACGHAEQTGEAPPGRSIEDVCTRDTTHDSVEELTELHGKAEQEIIAIMGEPDYEGEHVLHQGSTLPEFYIEVHNTYDPDDPATEGVVIREFKWEYEGYSKAIFLHLVGDEWMVLESVRWKDGVEF